MKNNKGITLIALIITIIIMLILAAVSISIAVNGNLFNYAKQGAEETEIAKNEELNLASGQVGDMTIDELIVGPFELANAGQDNNISFTISGYYMKNVPIPEGFSYKEGTVDTGYVIIDSSDNEETRGNEFVWVPVAKKQTISINITGDTDITKILLKDPYGDTILNVNNSDVETSYSNNEIAPTINGNYKLTITRTNGTTNKTLTVRSLYEKTTLETKCTNYYRRTIADLKNYSDEVTYKESVEKNGGFYVGRYEGGMVNENITFDRSKSAAEIIAQSGLPVCMPNKKPFANLISSQARGLAESVYTNKSFKCDLLTGAAYDRIFEWMIESGSKTENELTDNTASASWGVYYNSTVKSSDGSTILKAPNISKTLNTGVTTQTMVNNIYDIGGNMEEWTLERIDGCPVHRGATYFIFSFTSSPLPRLADDEDPNNGDSLSGSFIMGFRPALYL